MLVTINHDFGHDAVGDTRCLSKVDALNGRKIDGKVLKPLLLYGLDRRRVAAGQGKKHLPWSFGWIKSINP